MDRESVGMVSSDLDGPQDEKNNRKKRVTKEKENIFFIWLQSGA
jgi:hypothetical protein